MSFGFHGGGISFRSSAAQSIPSKNGCIFTSSASANPAPSRSEGSRMSSREISADADGENRFCSPFPLHPYIELQLR